MSEFVPLSQCSLRMLHLWRWHSALVCLPSRHFLARDQLDVALETECLSVACWGKCPSRLVCR
jgi:hypothetical protein